MLISRELIVELFNLMVNRAVKYIIEVTVQWLIFDMTNYSIVMVSIQIASFKEHIPTVA